MRRSSSSLARALRMSEMKVVSPRMEAMSVSQERGRGAAGTPGLADRRRPLHGGQLTLRGGLGGIAGKQGSHRL